MPTMPYMAAATLTNAGLARTKRLFQNTGLEPIHNLLRPDHADDDDDGYLRSEVVHKVEDVLDEEYQAEEPNKKYGHGMRIRRRPD